ncbi:MAG: putative glycolipid-binding domain-containing protein [Actinomycetota bacterium]|nr:putative glycolipid-binding domain-containing protein [Actinomycetota bacterium]
MSFVDPPRYAAWRHREARDGFEVVFLSPDGDGYCLDGDTTAVEGDDPWAVRYVIRVDQGWLTRGAYVTGRSRSGTHELTVESVEPGRWLINGEPAAHLGDCLDVDLESSALTNALPVRRLGLDVGDHADAPAAYIRASDLRVGRLEQRYVRLPDVNGLERYRYAAPAFDFECELVYDEFGLLLEYPGIATRAA